MSDVNALLNHLVQKAVAKMPPVYRTKEAPAPTMHADRKPEEKPHIDNDVRADAHAKTVQDKVAFDAAYATATPAQQAKMSFDGDRVHKTNVFNKLKERVDPELQKSADYAKRVAPTMQAAMQPLRDAMAAESEDDPTKRRVFKPGETQTLPQGFLDDTKKEREAELEKVRKNKVVTGGATKEKTELWGGDKSRAPDALKDKKVPTLRGGQRREALRSELEHGDATKTYAHEKNFPERQKQIEDLAEKADPFMRKLEAGGDLSATHVDPVKARKAAKKASDGYSVGAGDKVLKGGQEVYGSGAKVFGNAEKIVPVLPDAGADADKDARTASRKNFWSEADIDPLKQTGARNTDRLIHTSPDTDKEAPDAVLPGQAPKKEKVDQRFWVTGDHYKSAVPVAPVTEGRYVESDQYKKAPEKDVKARSRYADPAGKVSSLDYQDQLEAQRQQEAFDEEARNSPTKSAEHYDRAVKLANENQKKPD